MGSVSGWVVMDACCKPTSQHRDVGHPLRRRWVRRGPPALEFVGVLRLRACGAPLRMTALIDWRMGIVGADGCGRKVRAGCGGVECFGVLRLRATRSAQDDGVRNCAR